MKTLVESLFDKNNITTDPIDFSYFKTKSLQVKWEVFYIIQGLMSNPDAGWLEEWAGENYYENEAAYDFFVQTMYDAFKKQGFDSWIDITENDFEELGGEMTEEEIDAANEELKEFFSKAYLTETNGYFMIGKGKIPELLTKLLKDTDNWNPKMSSIDTWAVCYWPDFGPALSFYGCPKNLSRNVKNLLYN